ncbi:MAG: hypothetical protein WD708_08265 [Kiritimatiellia bacterium]
MKEKTTAFLLRLRDRTRKQWAAYRSLLPKASEGPVRLPVRSFSFMRQLDRLRRRAIGLGILKGLSLAVAVVPLSFTFRCWVDYMLVMPWFLRLMFLTAELLFLSLVVYRFVLWPLRHPPTDIQVSLRVEASHPHLHSRLVSTLQLNQPGTLDRCGSPSLVRALTRQTEERVARLRFASAYPANESLRMFGRALAVLLLAAVGLYAGGEAVPPLIRRAFLSTEQVPRKTMVYSETGDATIGRGEDLRLLARAEGVLPGSGRIELTYASGRSQTLDLPALAGDPAFYERSIETISDSFTYTFLIGDGKSREYSVTVRDPPGIVNATVRITPPAYTHFEPLNLPLADIRALPGSVIEVIAEADRPLSAGRLTPSTVPGPAEMDVDPADSARVRGGFTVPLEGLRGFYITLTDSNGISTGISPLHPVRVTPDRPPDIRILYPVDIHQTVTPNAEVLLSFQASDDIEVNYLRLVYRINDGKESAIRLDLEEPGREVRRRFNWKIGEHLTQQVERGDVIEFFFEAYDNNTFSGPGRGESRNYVARVVSPDEKRAELLSRVLDNFTGLSKIATSQFELNQQLGELIEAVAE